MANLIVQILGSVIIIICGYLYNQMGYPMVALLLYGGGILWIYYNLQVFFIGKPKLNINFDKHNSESVKQ